MTLVRETFVRDPLTVTIPNDGVAKVTTPTEPEEWEVLKYELEYFVCEGEYERGLQRVLSSYSASLGRGTQPAAWVSGFFGCGKSHFVRVLEYLWRDVTMPDGASTRSLVSLTPDIDELLRELTTAGKREGGLWSAAGTLSSGAAGFVRASVLGVIFKSAGLPVRIPQAELVLYLRAEEGKLRARLCALIFLVDQLPSDLRIKPTVETLVDLLVTDLPAGSAALRERIPALLEGLVERGKVMQVDDEYRLQTREGAEWEQAYRTTAGRIRSDDAAIAAARTSELKDAVADALREVRPVHGESKTPRQVEVHYSEDAPEADLNAIVVWVRDEWSTTDKAVRTDAQQAGVDSPTLFAHLPRVNADALREHLAGLAAANEVLATKGMPSGPEGQVARSSIETRRDTHARRVDALVREVLDGATVYPGGGNVVSAVDLAAAITQGAKFSMDRLYSQFRLADHKGWGKVMDRARQGNADALQQVDHSGDAAAHRVCRELLQYIGTSGKKGVDIRNHFGGVGYGWPRDAVDGALCVLAANGALRATRNGADVPVGDLDHTHISQTDFKAETVTLSTTDRLAIRKLLQDAGHPAQPGEEAAEVPRMLNSLVELAESAGGPAPLPAKPSANHLADLEQALRQAVTEAREAHLSAGTAKLGELTESESWKQLTEAQQEDIKAKCNLQPLPELSIGTRSELLSSLDSMPLSQWEDATAALAERVARALTMAAKLLEPKAERVIPPHAQLTTEAEVDEYLGGLREKIMEHIAAGKPVVL